MTEQGLTVLLTNRRMAQHSGTELYVHDLAVALLQSGHRPIVYSPSLGRVAEDLMLRTVPVVDDLERVTVQPDIIHGHHHPETMTALLHFPEAPAVFVCHDWVAWHDAAPRLPRIRRYIAVDDTCRDRLVAREGVPEALVGVLRNVVDLERFRPRTPLPPRPLRAAVFTNYAYDLAPLRAACQAAGIQLDAIGRPWGRHVDAPERILGEYDLVFAKARAALEAMAVGAAVIVCDARGLGEMVTSGNVDRLRALNFGIRAMSRTRTEAAIAAELRRYDPQDAVRVSARIRETATLDLLVGDWVELYREVIAEHAAAPPAALPESRAVARYIRDWEFGRGVEWERKRFLRKLGTLVLGWVRRLSGLRRGRAAASEPQA